MNENKTNKVINLGRNDIETLARTTGVLKENEDHFTAENDSPHGGDERPQLISAEQHEKLPVPLSLKVSGAVAAGAVALGAFYPRAAEDVPVTPPTRDEMIQEGVQKGLLESDEIWIGKTRVKNTVSETVANDPDIKELKLEKPGEVPFIVTSANYVPESAKYIYVVGRDVDKDGDKDATVVASE